MNVVLNLCPEDGLRLLLCSRSQESLRCRSNIQGALSVGAVSGSKRRLLLRALLWHCMRIHLQPIPAFRVCVIRPGQARMIRAPELILVLQAKRMRLNAE
jgi:hypothetical protein